MKYLLSKSLFSFIYFVSCSIITYSISLIGHHVVEIVLSAFMLVFCFYIATVVGMKTGEDALKVRHANDLERKEIIRTGRDIPLKLSEEYKAYRGFIIGLLINAPGLILIIVHTLVSISGSGNNMVFGKLADLVNMVFYWIINLFYEVETVGTVFYNLIFIAFFTTWFGLSYMLGAKKVMLQYQIIEQKHKELHGEEF